MNRDSKLIKLTVMTQIIDNPWRNLCSEVIFWLHKDSFIVANFFQGVCICSHMCIFMCVGVFVGAYKSICVKMRPWVSQNGHLPFFFFSWQGVSLKWGSPVRLDWLLTSTFPALGWHALLPCPTFSRRPWGLNSGPACKASILSPEPLPAQPSAAFLNKC